MFALSKVSRSVCFVCSVSAILPSLSQAQQTPDDAASNNLESIIVTGTRSSEKTVFDSSAPIDLIAADELMGTVSEDLSDTLAQLVPSYKVQRLPMADGQVFVRPASLRGLSADHTLVLINGKRRHRSALLGGNGAQAPDLSQIPASAIKRIEVLRDGASAQYGSDAIAGVINIILDDSLGLEGFVQYSEYAEGDGENIRTGIKGGMELGDDGFVTVSFEYADAQKTSRSRQRPDAIQFAADHPEVDVPNPVQNWGQPETETLRIALNSGLDTQIGMAYLFATFGQGEGLTDFNWRNPDSTSAFNLTDVFPDFDLRETYPAGFSPQFGHEDSDHSVNLGIKGTLSNDIDWDLSVGFGQNRIEYNMSNSINASLGPASPTDFYIGELNQTETNVNADFNYLWASSMLNDAANIAFGAEYRKETYEIKPGDLASYEIGPGAVVGLPSGSNGFPGFSPNQSGESSQNSQSVYVDIDLPISELLTIGLATRYEKYSEYGNGKLTGKLSARYEINSDLALRGTVSTGFKAPTPGQLFSERTSQGLDTNTLNIFTTGRFSPEGDVAAVLSQREDVTINPLEAEESNNLSAGIVYRHDSGFHSSLDFYRVDVDNRLSTSSTYTVSDEERIQFASLGVPGGESITRVNFYQNDFDTRTTGIDVVIGYTTDLNQGVLSVTSALNHNKTEVLNGSLVGNDTTRNRFENILPQNTANLSLNYQMDVVSVMARVRYYGSWTDYSGNSDGDVFQDFDGEFFTDLSASYNVSEKLTLNFGAENIFDSYPQEAVYQANRGLIYSRNAPYDTDGRNLYIRASFQL
ncbi:TonB-dependent receptor plug domain-containing protein [Aliiglaciecola lipolytica]|uniref:TonB-dependent receptor plug domain-containing protein n=1 Tax=Aliiglaciecola lipolytica TaxID=477689 RepID=UPI001C091A4E|nr:TonB-dependent receptor [Aliiglaciecola lipolytica]MBU2876838.1 TonB-dependent receptor [Aliiglaciecola lipolytica]